MSLITKLLGLWAVSRTVSSSTPIFMRLLVGMAAITFFAVFAAVITAIMVAGWVWFSYTQLLLRGFEPYMAVLLLSAIMITILATTLLVLQYHWGKVYKLAQRLMYLQSPVAGKFSGITGAFMDGFNTRAARARS